MVKVQQHSKRALGWFCRRLPWYGKILAPLVLLVMGIYLVEAVVSLFS